MQQPNALDTIRAHVLIVDDNPHNLLAMEASLERLDIQIVRAYSGPEALQVIQKQDFAVVLLDVQMPGMDGLETAEHIRNIPHARHTPIIFITAGDLTEDIVHRAYQGGAADFLFKPYAPQIVRAKVQTFVDLFKNSQELKLTIIDLAHAEEQVRKLNQALEQRVEERTRELEIAFENLEVSEKRYRQLAEFLPQIVWTGTTDGRIDYFNNRYYEFVGIPPGTDDSTNWIQRIHPDDRQTVLDAWQHSLKTGQPYQLEFRVYRAADQTWPYHMVRAEPLRRPDGTIEKWLGIATDIQERRQAEATLKAANNALQQARDHAVEASQAKSLFLANMSHEFRTPLNAILGYAEMLEEELRNSNTHLKQDADRIITAGQHLLSLIDDVLDMAKIEAGKMELSLETIQIEPVINSVISSIRGLAEQHQNKLYTTIQNNIGTSTVDPVKLRQILFNLLSNACKFTENGTVEVIANRKTRNDGQDWITIAVRDTGIGIPARDISRLFKEFSQADPSPSRHYEGTGLGLALSQRFAHMMGGMITLTSKENHGSTFTLKIPAVFETSSPTPPPQ